MPWYRSGTVAITAGQTSVVGTNTDFAANSRVGDAFQGPDGRWYEVANIASATVLSILPAYQGATVSAGGYGLAPMEGYVKDSADALRAIVNQYGAKLAALGTTGNYEILPVSKGGTGGNDQATARQGLGLGPAAVRDVTGGSGPLMARGAYGLGGGYSPGLPYVGDASGSLVENTGIYRYDTNTLKRPTFGTGFGALIHMSAISSPGLNYAAQIGIDYATTEMGFCALVGNAWLPWRKIYHDGNTTRAADGTLKAI